MTVTHHVALYHITFQDHETSGSPLLLVDLSDLSGSRTNGSLSIDSSTGRISGNGTFLPSFGVGVYTAHFCADFAGASIRDFGMYLFDEVLLSRTNLNVTGDESSMPAAAWVRFQGPSSEAKILARVGISFISVDRACHNAEDEVPDFDFQAVSIAAEKAWEESLGTVQILPGPGLDSTFQTIFWSGLYRASLSPQDYTNENPLWHSSEPYFDSYYCIWDSFRSTHPLLTITNPTIQTRMVRSLIDIYRHEGWLPDCRMSLCKGYTQGGSNADVVIADLYMKLGSVASGIDWSTAYEAVIKDAEVEPDNWAVQGRGQLDAWKSLHYIPTQDQDSSDEGPITRSISRTVEYAYNDFCISQMAQSLGSREDHHKYLQRATFWKYFTTLTTCSNARTDKHQEHVQC